MAFVDKLLAQADIMVTSFRDKALKKLGLDWESIHARHPHLVWGQMRGYGEYGPEKDTKGFDTTAYAARGGFLASLPQAGDHYQPINWPAAIGDWNSSITLTAGLLAALVRKERTGEGDKVTTNLHHNALWAMQIMLASSQFGDKWPKLRYDATCPSNNTYRSKDGVWFIICYGSYDLYFEHLMTSIGLTSLLGDERYTTSEVINNGNGGNTEVVKMLENHFLTQDWDYWEPIFKENEIPYQRLFLPNDILHDEEAFANDSLRSLHYDAYGDKVLPTSPVRLGSLGDPVLYRSRPVGFDTARIMKEFGYSDDDIDALNGTAVKCYDGPQLPESVLKPSFGPHSITD